MASRAKQECGPRSEIRLKASELEFSLTNLENALNEMKTDLPSDPCDDNEVYGSRMETSFTGLSIAEDFRLAPQCPLKAVKALYGNIRDFLPCYRRHEEST